MTFSFKPAVREATPLLVGLTGPSSSGKTRSGLRIGTGIVSVRGGELVVLDTEARRSLHYADRYKFPAFAIQPPFGSDRYAEALLAAAEAAKAAA
jgi:hypothetical protein